MNKNKKQQELIECIKADNLERFLEEFEINNNFGSTSLDKSVRQGNSQRVESHLDSSKSLDQFGLLTQIVKYNRLHFLEAINKKSLFPITQKDEYTGDTLLHYAIFESNQKFATNPEVLSLFENEVNSKNARGNTPFHYACLKGNLEIIVALFNIKKASRLHQQSRAEQSVNIIASNKAGFIPLQLAISRGHYFVVHFLLCQESVINYLTTKNDFEIYQCLKLAISARASQIFYLIEEVFKEQIDEYFSDEAGTFWERSFDPRKRLQKTNSDTSLTLTSKDQTSHLKSDERDSDNEDIEQSYSQGQFSLLHYAASGGDFEIFQFVLGKCLNSQEFLFDNQSNPNNETPLHWAVSCAQQQIVQLLIATMRDEVKQAMNNQLSMNSSKQRFNNFSEDENSGIDGRYQGLLEIKNVSGHTPFFVAIIKGHLEIADILLADLMSDINSQDDRDDSPLHWAVILQKKETVKFLLERGAHKSVTNSNKNSPLMIACLNGNLEIIKMLLEDSSDKQGQQKQDASTLVNQINSKSMTPMHAACLIGDYKTCRILLEAGANMQQKDIKGFLPIHYAVINDHDELLTLLKEHHKIDIFDQQFYCNGHRLLTLAIQNGSYNTVKRLVNHHKVNVMEREAKDFNYLHIAAISGHVNIFLFLLSKQVPPNSKTATGKTVWTLAQDHGHHHLSQFMKDKFDSHA